MPISVTVINAVMSLKSVNIVLVLLIFGFAVCRSHSDRIGNGHGSDFTADCEIISTNHIDIVEPVHGSYEQPSEHATRSRRASDGANVSLPDDEHVNKTAAIDPIPISDGNDASIPTTTEHSVSNDSYFETYFLDFLQKNPDVRVLRSPKIFDNQNKTWTLGVEEGRNVEVVVHLLDINPFSNYLTIKSVHADNDTAIRIAGPITPKNVQKIEVMDTQEIVVIYQFANSQSSKYDGFVLTYKSIGIPDVNGTSNSNVTIPLQEYSSIKLVLEVPKIKQNNETMAQLRLLFAQSTNKFIAGEKLSIEPCKIENVKFIDVAHCMSTWPNSENCIQIELAIPLKTITNATALNAKRVTSTNESGEDIVGEHIEYELTIQHLHQMWEKYGESHFAQNEFHQFSIPELFNQADIITWTLTCLSVLILFLLVLCFISKIDFLKDYRRMHWKISDDQNQMCKQSEIDISMFPSPHQAVPTLFPNDLAAPSAGLPYEYVNQPISFNHCDFKRRESLEESMKLDDDANEKHEAGVVPFQSEIIDFNEPHAEDEITFSRAAVDSPRGQAKFRPNGKNESIS